MKKYDRETKKWVEAEEVERKQGKRKMCKGGREHDWMLCLPPHVKTDTELGLDKVIEYYKIQDEFEDMEIEFQERLEEIGVSSASIWFRALRGRHRSYICTVCLKRS